MARMAAAALALLLTAAGCSETALAAQSATSALPPPDASVGAALRNLASRSAVVFAGQVVSIQRKGGVVEVAFRVDAPVLGQTGGTYTLREWAGMWPPGQTRYHVGERAMVFLHGASSAGLSSAVDGYEGVVPLMRGADGTVLLDVRRLGTRVERQIGQPLPDPSVSAISFAEAVQVVTNWQTTRREPSRRPLPPEMTVLPRPAAAPGQRGIALRLEQQGGMKVVIERSGDEAQ
jgi:hypothetical protein